MTVLVTGPSDTVGGAVAWPLRAAGVAGPAASRGADRPDGVRFDFIDPATWVGAVGVTQTGHVERCDPAATGADQRYSAER